MLVNFGPSVIHRFMYATWQDPNPNIETCGFGNVIFPSWNQPPPTSQQQVMKTLIVGIASWNGTCIPRRPSQYIHYLDANLLLAKECNNNKPNHKIKAYIWINSITWRATWWNGCIFVLIRHHPIRHGGGIIFQMESLERSTCQIWREDDWKGICCGRSQSSPCTWW